MQTIELQALKSINGNIKYSAILDGKVIATRTSKRTYVAALVYEGQSTINNGIGRADLIEAAVRKNPGAQYLAVIPNIGAAGDIYPAGTVVEVTERLHGHRFEIGQPVTLGAYISKSKSYPAKAVDGVGGYLQANEFKTLK